MKAELINPFINATVNVLKTMAQVDPTPGKPYLKTSNATWGVVTGLIGMAGPEMTGNLCISFDEPCVLKIVSNMLMEDIKTVSSDVVDAVGEITNMISGGTKNELSEQGMFFDMATPCMIRGENVEVTQLGGAPIIAIPFSTPNGQFVVEASLIPRAKTS